MLYAFHSDDVVPVILLLYAVSRLQLLSESFLLRPLATKV